MLPRSTEILQLLVKYPARAEYILDIAVASVNPIYRPSLVDVAVKRLLNATNKQLTTPTVPLSRAGQLTLIGMLTKTISTGGLAVGVTVLELVDSLTQLLNKSIEEQMRSRDGTVRPITGVVRQDVQELEDALIKCVGSLAVSVYYPTQVNDIVGFIVNRLRDEHPISRPAERPTAPNGLGQGEHEDLVASEVRKSLVRCLREVMETAVSGTETATFHSHTSLPLDEVDERPKWTSISVRSIAGTSTSDGASNTWSTSVRRTPLPDEYVTPLISFLESSDSELRLECGLFLYYFLNDAADQRDESGSAANVFHAKQLRHELHGAMYRIASSASSLPVDLILVYLNLLSMLHKYGSNELLEVVPWTFAAQKRAIDELETDLPRNRAVMGLVVKLYEQIAERFASGPLQKLVADSLAEMRDLNWFFSSLELARVEETAGKPWPQVEGTVGAAGRVLERSAVIEALLADSSLASKSDARAALESSYDPSGPLLPDPEPPKIEVSPPSGNGKPIAISTSVLEAIVSTEIRTPPPKPIVDVSNLKRALDGPSDVRAVSPAPSNAMSVGTASSPVAGRGHGGRDSETTSLARSNVSVARLEKKKALSAEAATLLAHLTGPYQPKASSTSSTPKAANGLTPAQISLANLARPGSPSNRDKENGKVVRLVVQDAN